MYKLSCKSHVIRMEMILPRDGQQTRQIYFHINDMRISTNVPYFVVISLAKATAVSRVFSSCADIGFIVPVWKLFFFSGLNVWDLKYKTNIIQDQLTVLLCAGKYKSFHVSCVEWLNRVARKLFRIVALFLNGTLEHIVQFCNLKSKIFFYI